MKVMINSFEKLIIIAVFFFYVLFLFIIFFIFNSLYYNAYKQNYMRENQYLSSVAKDMFREEEERLLSVARILANDDGLYYAMKDNVYSDIKHDEKGNIIEKKEQGLNRISYIKMANALKSKAFGFGRGAEEKGLAIYDKNGKLGGYSEDFPKDMSDNGTEKYIRDCLSGKELSNNSGIDITFIQKKGDQYYLKVISPIGKSSRFRGIDYTEPYGMVIIGEKLEGVFLEKIKKTINREVIIVYDNKIMSNTFFINGERAKKTDTDKIIPENRNNLMYKELTFEGTKIGFSFTEMVDYEGKVIGYLGVGNPLDEFQAIYDKNVKKFAIYEIVFSILFFIFLYFVLKKMFKPFDIILESIKYMKNGKYDRIEVKTFGELKMLADSINNLSMEIETRETKLKEMNQNLEKSVQDRTLELEDTIEKLKKTQEELVIKEKMASLGKFAGGVAHEINNPLSAILAGIQMIKFDLENNMSNDLLDNVGIVEGAAKKAKSIISKLMKYVDKGENSVGKIEIDELVFRAISMVEQDMKGDNIKIDIDLHDGLATKGSMVDLTQVLMSILLNARDAVNKKAVEEKIIKVRTFSKYKRVYVEVEDNGIGIKSEDKLKIYDPFFTTKEVGKGMGLGLAMGYDVLKKNNANISFVSEEGKGTTFILDFEAY